MKAIKSILFMAAVVSTTAIFAQPNSSSGFEDVTDTPVNVGLALMLVAGVGYGIKKLYKKSK